MFCFYLWRMTLWGLGLGSGLGTTHGLLLGGLTLPFGIGFLVVWPLFGTVGGRVLGVLCGTVLWIFTLAYRPRDASRYRAAAGPVCAAATALAVVSCWEISMRPSSGTASLASHLMWEEYLAETVILVTVPALVATGAAWWAGRRVAEQYTRKFGERVNRRPMQATGEKLEDKRRRR